MPFETFQKMVEYFYTGNLKCLTLTDCGWLLSFADFYLLPENLTRFCNTIINHQISSKNWQEAFVLGLQLKNKKLKKAALEVIPESVDQNFVSFFLEIVEKQQATIDVLKEENARLRALNDDPLEE